MNPQAVNQQVQRFSVKRVDHLQPQRVTDLVAREEPLAIHVSHWIKATQHTDSVAVTMRTPGADRELTAGLLLTEGIIRNAADVTLLRPLGTEPSNEILAELAVEVDFDAWRQSRHGFVSSSCGVCGKATLDQIVSSAPELPPGDLRLSAAFIHALPSLLLERQEAFAQTGGLHAATLVSKEGKVLSTFEDIGRHNALDKLIGAAVLQNLIPLHDHVVFVSSRGSFELVQKAVMAGVLVLATVGGPSSLAIETARRTGLTLIGFVRDDRFSIYSGDWRIDL